METLAILARIKKAHPELRIGQIIVDAIPVSMLETLFYMEDYELVSYLLNFERGIKH